MHACEVKNIERLGNKRKGEGVEPSLLHQKKGSAVETHPCYVRFVLGICEKGSSTKTWVFSSSKKGRKQNANCHIGLGGAPRSKRGAELVVVLRYLCSLPCEHCLLPTHHSIHGSTPGYLNLDWRGCRRYPSGCQYVWWSIQSYLSGGGLGL